ncbi:MAG: 50S ribosomal protein L11 methyltransferase [Desulfobulbaceae bacterium]|nr:50S ribosomal protein L11 methyltransferase [Desulfobulbaceae bacterium]
MPATTISHRPPRSWLKIEITAAPSMGEQIAAFVATISEGGVEISMPAVGDTTLDLETVTGYLADDLSRPAKEEELTSFLSQLGRQFAPAPPPTLRSTLIEEEDWGKSWKEHFKPALVTPRIAIKPSWEPYHPVGDEIVIEMDPGMAFGTGLHASTRLALGFIDECYASAAPPPQRVLDVGTGTGVLGMAAALFGASEVLAIDNDPDAVAAALENVHRNGLDSRMRVSGGDLAAITVIYDLVIANITSNVLTELAPQLMARMASPGRLILAGILGGEQEEEIVATYTGLGLRHLATRHQEEWAALSFARP